MGSKVLCYVKKRRSSGFLDSNGIIEKLCFMKETKCDIVRSRQQLL